MPSNLVNSPQDEKVWEQARHAIHKKYGNIKKGTNKYWKLVAKLYLRMKGKN